MHHDPPVAPDHLYNFITAAGALAAVAGLLIGAVVALLYSRKAAATVSAQLHETPNGIVLAVRPGVQALGPFKLKFATGDKGAEVTVTPVFATEKGTRSSQDKARQKPAFPKDITGKAQFVSPGETLTSSRIFRVDPLPPDLIGWIVTLSIASRGLVRRGLHWADETFVPVASPSAPEGPMTQNPQAQQTGQPLPPASDNEIEKAGGGNDEGPPASPGPDGSGEGGGE